MEGVHGVRRYRGRPPHGGRGLKPRGARQIAPEDFHRRSYSIGEQLTVQSCVKGAVRALQPEPDFSEPSFVHEPGQRVVDGVHVHRVGQIELEFPVAESISDPLKEWREASVRVVKESVIVERERRDPELIMQLGDVISERGGVTGAKPRRFKNRITWSRLKPRSAFFKKFSWE